jgi:hypothetical protein
MPRDDIPGAHIEEVEKVKQTHADLLISLAQAADLFHTPDGTGFADLIVNGHRETWGICSKGFKLWLKRRFFEAKKGAPSAESLRAALGVIEAKALFDGAERTVHIRVAGLADRLYLDLADADWHVVEVDGSGWRIIDKPPVRFRRAAGMRPIPIPQTAGSIADLRRFVNVTAEPDFVLVVAWLLAALRDRGPYPVLALVGEQGSAKSFLATLLRMLIDPSVSVLRSPPREDRDLFIAATNGHVIAIDNVSSLPPWLSDALCRLATGGGFATRQLYTDQDEVLLDAQRPIALTGIEDFVIRATSPTVRSSCGSIRYRKTCAAPRRNCWRRSRRPDRASWGRCSTPSRMDCGTCRLRISTGSRVWRISRSGRRLARALCGRPARSSAPMPQTAPTRTKR